MKLVKPIMAATLILALSVAAPAATLNRQSPRAAVLRASSQSKLTERASKLTNSIRGPLFFWLGES